MEKDKWPVHEGHCCPKHGCKYGDSDCPVVLGETKKHNKHCEDCKEEYENPNPIDLLMAWTNSHSDCVYVGYDEWGHAEHRDVVSINDMENLAFKIKNNKRDVVNLGKKEGWWRKEDHADEQE